MKKISQSGIDFIKKHEGFTAKPIRDQHRVSIGYGNTFYPNGKAVQLSDPAVTKAQAETILKHALTHFENAVNKAVKVAVSQSQFDALVSLCYNIGEGNFLKSTLLKMVNSDPNDPAIWRQFLAYNKAGGKVLTGLTNRRKAEAQMYQEGSQSDKKKV